MFNINKCVYVLSYVLDIMHAWQVGNHKPQSCYGPINKAIVKHQLIQNTHMTYIHNSKNELLSFHSNFFLLYYICVWSVTFMFKCTTSSILLQQNLSKC